MARQTAAKDTYHNIYAVLNEEYKQFEQLASSIRDDMASGHAGAFLSRENVQSNLEQHAEQQLAGRSFG